MKTFHVTGTCIPQENFMVDTSHKLDQIMKMIERKEYFVINRPRQYGKTTTMFLLWQKLLKTGDYLPINMSFESFDDTQFENPKIFSYSFLFGLAHEYTIESFGYSSLFSEKMNVIDTFQALSFALKDILSKIPKKVVLMIDEVDKSTNNDLFLQFLGMLRDKYLRARTGLDVTFHSVILAGVNDIKSLKQKIRPDATRQYNSPWNIAADFNVDMSFSPAEIETMLSDYVSESGISMDTKAISERLYFWTSGYPFLVSYICKKIDEDIVPARQSKTWEVEYVDSVAKKLDTNTNTLFDVLIKNLESYQELYTMIEDMILGLKEYKYDLTNPLISQSSMYGFISCNDKGFAQIHNKLFQQKIINYIVYRASRDEIDSKYTQMQFIRKDGTLDFELLLTRFQDVMKAKWSKTMLDKSDEFLEKDLRLLFVMFLHPILNGKGSSFHEVQIAEEKRLDIVVTFLNEMFVVELKLWYSQPYHEKGKKQLKDYMQRMSIDKGYMLILDRTRKKAFKQDREDGMLMVYV